MNEEVIRKKERIEAIVKQAIKEHPLAITSLNAIREAYKGKIWLVGGFIRDLAVNDQYGLNIKIKDADFMLAEPIDPFIIKTPYGWERTETNLKGLRFKRGDEEIDIWSSSSPYIDASVRGDPELTLDYYFRHVPITIQVLAYDLETEKIHGDIGIQALLTETVAINNLESLKRGASKRKQTPKEYLQIILDKIVFFEPIFTHSEYLDCFK